MSAYAYHVRAEGFRGKRQLHEALHGVRVQKRLRLARPEHSGDARDVRHAACLVVDHHQRDENGVLPQRLFNRADGDGAVGLRLKETHLEAALFKLAERFSHRVVLNGGGDYVPALTHHALGAFCYRPIIALGAAGGEKNLVWNAAERVGDLPAGPVQNGLCLAALRVGRAWVTVEPGHDFISNIRRLGADHGRGGVIKIDFHFDAPQEMIL